MMGFLRFYKSQNGLLWNENLSSLVNNGYSRISPFGLCGCYNVQNGLPCEDEIVTLRSGNNGDNKQAYLGRGENCRVRSRRRFSSRLSPRSRLLTIRIKRASIRSLLNDVGLFEKEYEKGDAFCHAFVCAGVVLSVSEDTALPSLKMVPYSDLINVEEAGEPSGESMAISLPNESVGNKVASDDVSKPVQPVNVNLLKKFSRKRASIPDWQYAMQKEDHDEEFLLSLLREKGTICSSAPQSVPMSMRSTLITVITLWIPLIPLM